MTTQAFSLRGLLSGGVVGLMPASTFVRNGKTIWKRQAFSLQGLLGGGVVGLMPASTVMRYGEKF
jgi:uncharacterized membrane protein YesL